MRGAPERERSRSARNATQPPNAFQALAARTNRVHALRPEAWAKTNSNSRRESGASMPPTPPGATSPAIVGDDAGPAAAAAPAERWAKFWEPTQRCFYFVSDASGESRWAAHFDDDVVVNACILLAKVAALPELKAAGLGLGDFTWMMPDAGATRRRAEIAAVPKRSSNGRPGRPTRPFASRVNASAMRASCSLLYGSHVPSGF